MTAREDPAAALAAALARLAPRLDPAATGVEDLRPLTGGAVNEIWAFRLTGPGTALILRRPHASARPEGAPSVEAEAEIMARAAVAGAPAPAVLHVLTPGDGIGEGYVMSRVEGETLPGRVLKRPEFAPAPAAFAAHAGRALAAIHRTDVAGLGLRTLHAADVVEDMRARHAAAGPPRPVFALALRWLADRTPPAGPARLVHGDFRMGNLMLGPEGLRAVLDWELAHRGDPLSDLGWLCMESWRFGGTAPVGGMGAREDLFAAYEAAGGGPVDPDAVRWWELLAALRWGVMCDEMGEWVRTGADRSVERQAVARRASEAELILMAMLTGRAA